jgi:hypothetical protein
MAPQQTTIEPAVTSLIDQPGATARTDETTLNPPAPSSLPAAPETIAEPHAVHDSAVPLRPTQRGLSLLCSLLRALREE